MEQEYTPSMLARLALSDRVRDLVDDAVQVVPTLDDGPASPSLHLTQALLVRAHADKVVGAAILHARAHGLAWAEIAMYAGIRPGSFEQRWAPEEDRWHDLLQRAQNETGPQPLDRHLVFAPAAYAHDLDTWAVQHLDAMRIERWEAEGKDASHPVTGGLSPEPNDPERR